LKELAVALAWTISFPSFDLRDGDNSSHMLLSTVLRNADLNYGFAAGHGATNKLQNRARLSFWVV
jgi:hypothetical protein